MICQGRRSKQTAATSVRPRLLNLSIEGAEESKRAWPREFVQRSTYSLLLYTLILKKLDWAAL